MGGGGKNRNRGGKNRGGKKGSGKNGKKSYSFQRQLTPGVLVTAAQPSLLSKAAQEGVACLNEISDRLFAEQANVEKNCDAVDHGLQEGKDNPDEEESSLPAAKRRKVNISSEQDGGNGISSSVDLSSTTSLSAALASELTDLKEDKQKKNKKGWRFVENFSRGIAFLQASEYPRPKIKRSSSDGKNHAEVEIEIDEERKTHMSEKQKQSLRKQEIRSETWNMPSKVAKELFGICDADRDEPPRTAEVEVDHAVMKEPSKSRTNKTKYVIRLTPLDYVSTPHTNNFEMLLQKIVPKEVAASRVLREVGFSGSEIPATMAAAFPNPTKGGQQSNEKESDEGAAAQHPGASTSKSTTKSPTTKTLLGDAIAAKLLAMERTTRTTHEKEHHPKLSYTWNLDFRKHNLSGNTGNKFVTKETCRDLIEKQLEKTFAKSSSQDKEEKMDSSIPGRQISFSVDITCPDFLFVVEVTPTFLGMSVLQDVEQWRDFKLFENDKENESEEERSCSAASDVDGEDGAGCTSGSEGEDGDLQTASEDEEKAVDA